jgi:hypothetical protein
MNIKSLRGLIRLSIKQKILSENRKKNKPLETFFDFRIAVQESLIKEGFEEFINDDLEDFIFESLYPAWSNIQTELELVSSTDKISTWNESVTFHLQEALENIIREISRRDDVSKVSKNVVCHLLK